MAVIDDRDDRPAPNQEDASEVTETSPDANTQAEESGSSQPPPSDSSSEPPGDGDGEESLLIDGTMIDVPRVEGACLVLSI